MGRKRSLVHGIGVNDADYHVRPVSGGRKGICPIYKTWSSMLERCYCKFVHVRQPKYSLCNVCDEWLTFSNFKAWMEKQDWQGKQLDKDILILGNTTYSPESCVFVDQLTNSFMSDCGASRGKWLIGAYWVGSVNKFQSRCRNPFTKKQEYLGYFKSDIDAHLTWKKRKHELACILADLQADQRVAKALRLRYRMNGDGE